MTNTISDAELAKTSTIATNEYLEDQHPSLCSKTEKVDIVKKNEIFNTFMHGFRAGVRYREQVNNG